MQNYLKCCHWQIESITNKLEADKEELKRCLAEIDALKVRSYAAGFDMQNEIFSLFVSRTHDYHCMGIIHRSFSVCVYTGPE